jgi:hypothetical protein
MFIVAGIFYAIIIANGSIVSGNLYDAPIPDRCATLEKATDSTNGDAVFCKAWFKEHRVQDKNS